MAITRVSQRNGRQRWSGSDRGALEQVREAVIVRYRRRGAVPVNQAHHATRSGYGACREELSVRVLPFGEAIRVNAPYASHITFGEAHYVASRQ